MVLITSLVLDSRLKPLKIVSWSLSSFLRSLLSINNLELSRTRN
nr:MAG TPA: hypothetical protein [Bacteriophage sp.]